MAMTVGLSADLKRALRRSVTLLRQDRRRGQTFRLFVFTLFLTQAIVIGLLASSIVEQKLLVQSGLKINVLSTASDQEVQDFFAAAHADPSVKDITLVTKERAYDDARRENPALIAFIDRYKIQDPFRDTFVITPASSSSDAFRQFVSQDRWQTVIDRSALLSEAGPQTQSRTALSAAQSIQTALVASLVICLALLFCLLHERMKLYLRDHAGSTLVQEMLGASPMTVLLPLVFSLAIILGLALIAVTFLLLALIALAPMALSAASSLGTFPATFRWMLLTVFPWIFLLELCLMPAIAYGTALFGTARTSLHS